MLIIDDNALKLAKEKCASFIVKTVSSGCGCGGGIRKSIFIELSQNFNNINNNYIEFTYQDIKIYISRGLKIEDNAKIYLKSSIPLIGPVFGTKGMSII
ncbi:hypothetical protein [Clostridium sp. JNZ J1-5]